MRVEQVDIPSLSQQQIHDLQDILARSQKGYEPAFEDNGELKKEMFIFRSWKIESAIGNEQFLQVNKNGSFVLVDKVRKMFNCTNIDHQYGFVAYVLKNIKKNLRTKYMFEDPRNLFILKTGEISIRGTNLAFILFDEFLEALESTAKFQSFTSGYIVLLKLLKVNGSVIYKVGRIVDIIQRMFYYNYHYAKVEIILTQFVHNVIVIEKTIVRDLNKLPKVRLIQGHKYFSGDTDAIVSYFHDIFKI